MADDPLWAIDAMTRDEALQGRIAACAARESDTDDPPAWAWNNRYDMCAAPGWGAAWASADASGTPDPGRDDAVITDGMILAQVQTLLQ